MLKQQSAYDTLGSESMSSLVFCLFFLKVRLHEFSDSSLTWKRGSYLRKNGHLCLVRQTRYAETLSVQEK